ncbi:hypothetical protein B0H13DRAFT_2315344 [Mycena leptocephala]|nr:hypothetical protein B0H13DRAFT_2315344 [Mycena leptocephala]
MFSDHLEHSVHIPAPMPSSSELGDNNVNGDEKPSYPPTFQENEVFRRPERKFQLRPFLSKLVGWPAILIGGQLALQIATWVFFAVLQKRGYIALPYSSADWIQNNAHQVTVFFTAISTVLATYSCFLFSLAVRNSIALHLHGKGMSVSTFISTIKISSRSIILDTKKRKWSAISIVLLFLTLVQSSGWSGLLTPLVIQIETQVTGHELNLTSPSLDQHSAIDLCVVNGSNMDAFIVGQPESGYAVVKDWMRFPAGFTLMDQTFDISTAGILPLTLFGDDVNASSWFTHMTTLPGTLTPDRELPLALSAKYSMLQQGFTADVDCEFRDLTGDTSPNMIVRNDTVKDWNEAVNMGTVTYFQMISDCVVPDGSNLNTANAYTVGAPNYVMMIACGTAANTNYTLIFQGSGIYSFMKTAVCTLAPKVTTVQVVYSDSDLLAGTISPATLDDDPTTYVGGPAGVSAITTLFNMQLFAQGTSSNIVGDQLRTSIKEVSSDFDDGIVLTLLAEYIRGVTEYSGSVLRACLSGTNGTGDGVLPNRRSETNGHVVSQTAGWLSASAATICALIPGTIIAIATIYIVLAAVAYSDHEGDPFDPANAMHLVTASAAGGLNNVFSGTEEEDIKAAQDVKIVLGVVPGRGPALIRRAV